MSADNYYFVRKRSDGKFGVSHRFASCYYADEGHTVEIDEDWIAQPPEDFIVADTGEDAILAAHKAEEQDWTEYGVSVGEGVL